MSASGCGPLWLSGDKSSLLGLDQPNQGRAATEDVSSVGGRAKPILEARVSRRLPRDLVQALLEDGGNR